MSQDQFTKDGEATLSLLLPFVLFALAIGLIFLAVV
jgi:hypothetical protein